MYKLRNILTIFFFLISFISRGQTASNTSKIFADTKQSSVTYSMNHPMHDWDGVSKDMKAVVMYNRTTQLIENVAVSVKVATFDSQNANRDSHMIETVEGIKYPNVTFSSTSVKQDGNKISIMGTLNFHGVSKPISIEVQKSMQGKTMVIDGSFQVLMTEFKIEKPSLMGMPTSDIIKLKLHFEFLL
jgi:polyisoprenoid-binding protein YceI